MKPLLLATSVFGLSLPLLFLGLSSLHQPQLTAQRDQCAGEQVFRASDQRCYTLQGE